MNPLTGVLGAGMVILMGVVVALLVPGPGWVFGGALVFYGLAWPVIEGVSAWWGGLERFTDWFLEGRR